MQEQPQDLTSASAVGEFVGGNSVDDEKSGNGLNQEAVKKEKDSKQNG